MERPHQLNALRLPQRNGVSVRTIQLHIVYLVRRRDASFVADNVQLRAQHQRGQHKAADPQTRPAPAGKNPEGFLQEHFRDKPAERRADQQEQQQEPEGFRGAGSLSAVCIEDDVEQHGEADAKADGDAPAEHGLQAAHGDHVPGALHPAAAEQQQRSGQQRQPHHGIENQNAPAGQKVFRRFPDRVISDPHIREKGHRWGKPAAERLCRVHLRAIKEEREQRLYEQPEADGDKVQDAIKHRQTDDAARQLGAEHGEAIVKQQNERNGGKPLHQLRHIRVVAGNAQRGEQAQQKDDDVRRQQRQYPRRNCGKELSLPAYRQAGHAVRRTRVIEEAEHRHRREQAKNRSNDRAADGGPL